MLLFSIDVDSVGTFWGTKKTLNIELGEGGDALRGFSLKIEKCVKSFVRDCLKGISRHYSSPTCAYNLSIIHMMTHADAHLRAKGEVISIIS